MSIFPGPCRHVRGNANLAVMDRIRSWVEKIGNGIRCGVPRWLGWLWGRRVWVICGRFGDGDIVQSFDGAGSRLLLLLNGGDGGSSLFTHIDPSACSHLHEDGH